MDKEEKIDEIKKDICDFLKEGITKKDAAIMAGISEATFYRWIEENESFKSRVEASILEYKHTLIKNVNTCAEKDGRLALEVLSRRYPKEWGVKTQIEVEEDQQRLRIMRKTEEILDGLCLTRPSNNNDVNTQVVLPNWNKTDNIRDGIAPTKRDTFIS